MRSIQCIYCLSKAELFATKYCLDEEYQIYKCSDCYCGFVFPFVDESKLIKHYESNDTNMVKNLNSKDISKLAVQLEREETNWPESSKDAELLVSDILELKPSGYFLDIGAGFGWFSKEAKKYFSVTPLEANQIEAKVCEYISGLRTINSFLDDNFITKNKNKYDVILLSQVLEHLSWENQPVNKLEDLLAPGGVICVSVPNFRSLVSRIQGKDDMFMIPPEHVNYFSIKGLRQIFESSGFECHKIYTVGEMQRARIFKRSKIHRFLGKMLLGPPSHFLNCINQGLIINAVFRKK